MAGQYIVSETIETGGGGHHREIKYLHKERGKNTQQRKICGTFVKTTLTRDEESKAK